MMQGFFSNTEDVFLWVKDAFEAMLNGNSNCDDVFSLSPCPEIGDFKLFCDPFAKSLGKSPRSVARELSSRISTLDAVKSAFPIGPNIYLTLQPKYLGEIVCGNVLNAGDLYGNCDLGKGESVNVSFPSPNLNKPLHLGHLRNICIGMSLNNILKAANFRVVKTCTMGDCGIHICKAMVAYKKWGNGATPESENIKGDHFVGHFYVLFEKNFAREFDKWAMQNHIRRAGKADNKSKSAFFNTQSILGAEVRKMLKDWENRESNILELWNRLNTWVINGFQETFNELGIDLFTYYDHIFYDSQIYEMGKKIVSREIEKGNCKRREDNSVWIDLPNYGPCILMRSDGSPLYITQNIAGDINRFIYYSNLHRKISILGAEQSDNSKMRGEILNIFGYECSRKFRPLVYGMVYLNKGQKMSSRRGVGVLIDELVADTAKYIRNEVLKEADNEELPAGAAVALIKYYFLSVKRRRNIYYNLPCVISKGAALLHVMDAAKKINAVTKNQGDINSTEVNYSILSRAEERELMLQLFEFKAAVRDAARFCEPSIIARYVCKLSRGYSKYYRECIVDVDDMEIMKSRQVLSMAVRIVLEKGLHLLSIDTNDCCREEFAKSEIKGLKKLSLLDGEENSYDG